MRIRWSRNGSFWRADTNDDLAAEIADTRKPYPLRRGRIPWLGRARLCRPRQAAPAEREVALRPPHLVAALLEHRETPHPEPRVVRRQLGERPVEHVVADVVRDGHVRVVRERQLAIERPAADLALQPLAVADAQHQRDEDDR